MKAFKFRPTGYLLSPDIIKQIKDFTAVESLIFFIENSFIFDEKILHTLPEVVDHFSDVLDLSDYTWLQKFFNEKVYNEDQDHNITYYPGNAICMKIVCELLLQNKYSFREDNAEENTIPKLPDPDHLDCSDLDIFYRRYLQNRIDQYNQIIKNLNPEK